MKGVKCFKYNSYLPCARIDENRAIIAPNEHEEYNGPQHLFFATTNQVFFKTVLVFLFLAQVWMSVHFYELQA